MTANKTSGVERGLPGLESFTIQDYIALFARRKWRILFWTLAIGISVSLVAHFIPNVYQARTTIIVDPRKVPDNFVASTVSAGVSDQLATLRQQILSSTNLTEIIGRLNLYKDLRGRKSSDELVALMTRKIQIDIAPPSERGEGTFQISFESGDPGEAAAVANLLASRFITTNVKDRQEEFAGTVQFIDQELAEAKKDLEEKEDRIRNIKSRYIADLPESQNMHVQAINTLQLDLRGEEDAISRAQQQKVYYQSQLLAQPQVINLDQNSDASELAPLQTQLSKAQTELDNLKTRYGLDHPDVVKKAGEVKDLEQRIRALKEQSPVQRPASAPAPHNPVLESQIASLDQEIQNRTKHEAEIKAQITYHQSKLERIPILEQQLAAVNRDYENARDHYKLLTDRKFSADISSSLESFQKGERFTVLDPARSPLLPIAPNRRLLNIAGLCLGFMIGLTITVGTEMLDSRIKTAADLERILQVPVLAEIPVLMTATDFQKQKIRGVLAALGCGVLVLVFVALALTPPL